MSSSCNDIIATLSHRQLQEECRHANLSAGGSSQVLRRRLRGWKNMQSNKSRKKQKTSSSPADDLVCPITMELPFDPVTAEDGRVYERSAIQRHFDTHQDVDEIKSPVTNEPMGDRLFPSPQLKNHIHTLVESGVITGEFAKNWKEKEQEKKDMENMLHKAEGGDVDSMYNVGCNYRSGENGFEKNKCLAYDWFLEAHGEGMVKATARVGVSLLKGRSEGAPKRNQVLGLVLLTMAAERGSDMAAFHLGRAFANEKYGLPTDTKQALFWLEKSLSDECEHKHMNDKQKKNARLEMQDVVDAIEEEEEDDDEDEDSSDIEESESSDEEEDDSSSDDDDDSIV